MHSFIIETGKHKGKRLKLPNGETIVGRDDEAGIRVGSKEVSRRHCAIVTSDDELRVRDLGSSNGTFVNGTPITGETLLRPGDLLVVGPMGFRLQDSSGGTADSTGKAKPRRSSPDQRLSDDDIAMLLTDVDASASDDTAVFGVDAAAPEPAQPIPVAKKRVFKTVAEEAADIIRRHREAGGRD
ncbi:MAG: FHA domain-containing protein [Planctomycetaceae bacterium]